MNEQKTPTAPEITQANKDLFKGNILLFYAFDVGDDIDLEFIKRKNMVEPYVAPLSAYFKHYHLPLSYHLPQDGQQTETSKLGKCISSKIYHFGVFSFCYQIPFQDSFENLKSSLIEIKKKFDEQSIHDAKAVFKRVSDAIKKPHWHNLSNSYFAVQVYPTSKIVPEEFKENYGSKIASLLRLELYALSDYQTDEILSSTIGYYGQDFMIIDSEASFVYDDEYFEPMEFFELLTVQQLELQYFDRSLDQKLSYFYYQKTYTVPWTAYLPLIGERLDLPISRLAKLRVDISFITERLENSIKMAGEAYYTNLYSLLVRKMGLQGWRDSINRKLDLFKDLYSVYQDRMDTIHEEMLTIVIIILIAVEVYLAFKH